MTFDWGTALLVWSTAVFSAGAIIFIGAVTVFVIDTRRRRQRATVAERGGLTGPASTQARTRSRSKSARTWSKSGQTCRLARAAAGRRTHSRHLRPRRRLPLRGRTARRPRARIGASGKS